MHTSYHPEDWFVPVDALPPIIAFMVAPPALQVGEDGARVLIPRCISIGEDGRPRCTDALIQEFTPMGMPADRFQSLVFPCSCGNCPNTVIQIGVN